LNRINDMYKRLIPGELPGIITGTRKERKVSVEQLAAQMGTTPARIRSIEKGKYTDTLNDVEQVLNSIGYKLYIGR